MLLAGLGANPFSTIARGVATAVRDPRVQNVANVAAQQYTPQQYAQVRQYAAQVQRALRPPGQPVRQPMMPPMPPMPYEPVPTSPIKQSHILTIAGIAGASVLILMLMRK